MDFSILRKAFYLQKGSFAIKVLTTPGSFYILCCTILRAKAVEIEAIHPNTVHQFALGRKLIKTPHTVIARSPFVGFISVHFYSLEPLLVIALIKSSDEVQAWTYEEPKPPFGELWRFWSRGHAVLNYHLVLTQGMVKL